jgi:serine/threonine protein phosphatase PrpC
MRVSADCFGITDPGRVRPANEDQFLVADLSRSLLVRQTSLPLEDQTRLVGGPQGQLLLVADGLGGAPAGELASGLAVRTAVRYALNTMPWFFRLGPGDHDLDDELKAALAECHHAVERAGETHPEREGMGTTLTLAYALWPRLYVVHAGDSRAYLLRGGRLHRITRDQTVAQRLVDQGVITEGEAEGSRWSHRLWSCVGGSRGPSPDVYKAALKPGDTLLLCTDGLCKTVADDRIAALLDAAPETSARRLVAEANAMDGPDNITVVVARFAEAE